MTRWKIKVKEFEVLPDAGINPFDQDEVTDWLNEKGLNPEEIVMAWQNDILKIFYREWNGKNEDTN